MTEKILCNHPPHLTSQSMNWIYKKRTKYKNRHKRTNKQTNKQTNKHTYIHTCQKNRYLRLLPHEDNWVAT